MPHEITKAALRMASDPAPRGRHIGPSGTPQLAAAADRPAYLQIYSHLSRSYPNPITRYGTEATPFHPDQTADPLSHVLILRALRETAQVHARSGTRVPGEDWRSL